MGSGVSRPPPVSALPGRSLRGPRPPSQEQDQKSTRPKLMAGTPGLLLAGTAPSMPRELVTVQVGQCGNQIGCRFWDIALREHAAMSSSKTPVFDEPLSSFFRNEDSRSQRHLDVGSPVSALKARAVLIDTECGVLNSVMAGPLADIFDRRAVISDQFGAGNNWAQGHVEYGPKYHDAILESIRRSVEYCDSLQSFFLLHSLGGGTGSGLGTFVLSLLADHYPDVYRFTTSVFPSEDDDVVTSPYNSVLALNVLSEFADCVLPVENQALGDICRRVSQRAKDKGATGRGLGDASLHTGAVTAGGAASRTNSFDEMNNIAAHMLTHLTASMRFEGSLNVDLNEVTMVRDITLCYRQCAPTKSVACCSFISYPKILRIP